MGARVPPRYFIATLSRKTENNAHKNFKMTYQSGNYGYNISLSVPKSSNDAAISSFCGNSRPAGRKAFVVIQSPRTKVKGAVVDPSSAVRRALEKRELRKF
ncbi:hypothetical protein NQ318_008718 [Aromia moschata]|uniref:Uncharacterized protein n=1 Tax=Aromia moschata TaxID=1265417 RepID=A0AAV8Y550_9CUCU|nr:hypothetical protein NQ318_008718 [Aromia moschata]